MALDSCVRLRISRSRRPTSIKAACWSAVLIGTKRFVGRLIASHSASASAISSEPHHSRAADAWRGRDSSCEDGAGHIVDDIELEWAIDPNQLGLGRRALCRGIAKLDGGGRSSLGAFFSHLDHGAVPNLADNSIGGIGRPVMPLKIGALVIQRKF
jgi:hypothetical protein